MKNSLTSVFIRYLPRIVSTQKRNKLSSRNSRKKHLMNNVPIIGYGTCNILVFMEHALMYVFLTLLECDRSWVRAQSSQTKDYKISICCFSAKHAALRRKSKDWLAWNHENVFKLSNMTYLPVNCCFSELALTFFFFFFLNCKIHCQMNYFSAISWREHVKFHEMIIMSALY
jgi:hypothetical protein